MRLRLACFVAIGLVVVPACGGEADRRSSDAETGSSATSAGGLFLAGDGEMWIVDPELETVRRVAAPELVPGDPPHKVVARGDRLAAWGYDVWAIDPAIPGEPELIAKDGWIFIPAAHPRRIWVGYLDPDHGPRQRPITELREITVDGEVIRSGVRPPNGAWPYAELTDGLLFQSPEIALWDPDEERVVRSYRWRAIGDMGPVSGNLLASCPPPWTDLVLTAFSTGEQTRVAAPDGLKFVVGQAEFSPDGETLAVPVDRAGGWRSFSSGPQRLALVSLDDGSVSVIPGSEVRAGYVFVAWAPDGQRVFITGGERFEERTIVVYDLEREVADPLDVEVGDFYDVAAL